MNIKLTKSLELNKRLNYYTKQGNGLEEYRKFLDKKGIKAEDDDGFPSEFAYREENINDFIKLI